MIGEPLAFARLVAAQFQKPPLRGDLLDRVPVMVIPGLTTADTHTRHLRRTLKACGARPYGWGEGANLGLDEEKFERLAQRIDRIATATGQKVVLMGWSLGGIYARELAKRCASRVSMVITLGAPFSHLPDTTAKAIGHPDSAPRPNEKPPVFTVACWSDRDGMIPPISTAGEDGEADERVQLPCAHMDMVSDPEALQTIVALLKIRASVDELYSRPHREVRSGPFAAARSSDTARPGWPQLLSEAPAIAGLIGKQFSFPSRSTNLGGGRTIMVLPGFLASDIATAWFRRSIAVHGFRVYGWEQGLNRGADAAKFARLLKRIDEIQERAGHPIGLVGWSLGGLYARELAIQRQDKVSLVLTLGTPFSKSVRLNNAVKVYEAINDHRPEQPPMPLHMNRKPVAYTVAMWSNHDGIVAPAAAMGEMHEADDVIHLHCRHHELVGTAEPLAAVVDVLGRWAADDLPPRAASSGFHATGVRAELVRPSSTPSCALVA